MEPDLFTGRATCPRPAVFNSLGTAGEVGVTPEVLTCCTLDNLCDYYYLTLLVIYEHLNILAMLCYNLHPTQSEEDGHPS